MQGIKQPCYYLCHSQPPAALRGVSGAILSLILLIPTAVLAHAGHGEQFQEGSTDTQSTGSLQVDAETAKRLLIKVEPALRQQLAVGIKTTGQIETLPNQKVEVTAPIDGTVVKLLSLPGDKVSKGQIVAVLSSSELAQLRVDSVQKRAEAEPGLQQAQADLRLAKENYDRQQTLVATDIQQQETKLAIAQEKYNRDRALVATGALERRAMLDSATQVAEAKIELSKAQSRLPTLEANAQLKRATAAVEVAQSRIRLSSAAYQARLQQLSTLANAKGLVSVAAPISGTVADREITLGETISLQAGNKPLMTILNDRSVFATANIYEKDLKQVQKGQSVRVKIASLPDRTFSGRIALIGSVVEGDTRVVPVKAEIDNSSGLLKPGMFAELEVLTDRTPKAILAIPVSAVVDANGKKIVYVQSGNTYQPIEVTLGQTSGDMVEVKSGLFDGDLVVTQRATELYAQSLRGGSKHQESEKAGHKDEATGQSKSGQLPWWWILPVGGAIAGAFWAGRRSQRRIVPVGTEYDTTSYEIEPELKNSKHPTPSHSGRHVKEHKDPQEPNL